MIPDAPWIREKERLGVGDDPACCANCFWYRDGECLESEKPVEDYDLCCKWVSGDD